MPGHQSDGMSAARRSGPLVLAALLAGLTMAILPSHGDTGGWKDTFSPTLPRPSGDAAVGVRHVLLHTGQVDPWSPGHERSVMVDLFYPAAAEDEPLNRYYVGQHMSELGMLAWAPAQERRWHLADNEVNWLFRVHAHEWAPAAHRRSPVVVVSAPPGTMRSSYHAIAEDLASHGYVVVTVDHPYDAPVVELFPTRRVLEPDDAARALSSTRVAQAREDDLAYVVDDVDRIDDEVGAWMDPARLALVGWIGATGAQLDTMSRWRGVAAMATTVGQAPAGVSSARVPVLVLRRDCSLSDDPMVAAQVAAAVPRSRRYVEADVPLDPKAARYRRMRGKLERFLADQLPVDDPSPTGVAS